MKKIIKYIVIILVPLFCLSVTSCSSDDSEPEVSGLTIIYGIKILNAGADGTEIVVGTVDEDKKEISFPEVDPETNLSGVRFEVELPEGARMDEEEYNFTIAEGKSSLTRVISVINGKRKREYFATIRLDLPVFGADFSDAKMKVYDFSGQTTMYTDLAAANTRSAHMDKDYVLIVSREGGTRPHLLRVEDLKEGDASQPIMLSTNNVTGGTFAISAGRLAQGHVYICNLATPSPETPLKIYHWSSPTAEPELIVSLYSTDLTGYVAGRFGDYMSMDLDESGNGYIFLGVNASQTTYKALRLRVTGFTNVTEPTLINNDVYGGYWLSVNQVDGSPEEYLYTGHSAPIMLVNSNLQTQYTIPATTLAHTDGSDAQIITFNEERYMVMLATPGAGSIDIYDITDGDTTLEALTLFDEGNQTALRKYSLGGDIAAGTASGSIGWAKEGDETLYIMGAAPGAGFALLEFPKKVKEDDVDEEEEDEE
ncbi:MAG: DUF4623 domain-containing protein [Bacteroides sp.]|nr:DUF4623 domain-containing protein [Bacteroides sp.]